MEDIVLSAYATFHMQSPSFLQFQKDMETKEGKSNANSLFGIKRIPSDNHIRDILDNIPPSHLQTIYNKQLKYLKDAHILNSYRYMGKYPVALDGTGYYSSKKICCSKCLTKKHNEEVTYSHQAVTPALISPHRSEVIPLMPEFIGNEDGDKKQDCEINASKRLIKKDNFLDLSRIFLGDDLYAHEPFCRDVIENGDSFVFTAKQKSHKIMYEHIEFVENTAGLDIKEQIVGKAHKKKIWKFRFVNEVPINGNDNALKVGWLDVEVFDAKTGEKEYYNSFITDMKITKHNVYDIGLIGRTRWKIENENNNTLKTKGYHLEHNFGHGKENLAEFLFALNILAFLFHTVLIFLDKNYAKAKEKRTRERFFNEMEILTTHIYFFSWDILMAFLARDRDSPMLCVTDLMDISELTK